MLEILHFLNLELIANSIWTDSDANCCRIYCFRLSSYAQIESFVHAYKVNNSENFIAFGLASPLACPIPKEFPEFMEQEGFFYR